MGRLGWGRTGKQVRRGNKTKQTQQTQTNNAQSTKHKAIRHRGTQAGGIRQAGQRAARWAKAAAAVQYSIRNESRHALFLPLLDFSLGGFAIPTRPLSAMHGRLRSAERNENQTNLRGRKEYTPTRPASSLFRLPYLVAGGDVRDPLPHCPAQVGDRQRVHGAHPVDALG